MNLLEEIFGFKASKKVKKRSNLLKLINSDEDKLNLKILQYLKDNKDKLEQKEKNLALIRCVKKRFIAACIMLLDLGADPSYICREKYGYNCLMLAVLENYEASEMKEMVCILKKILEKMTLDQINMKLDKFSHKNCINYGKTALEMAWENRQITITKLLVSFKADVDKCNFCFDELVLLVCSINDCKKLEEMLKTNHINKNMISDLIILASKIGSGDLLEILIKYGRIKHRDLELYEILQNMCKKLDKNILKLYDFSYKSDLLNVFEILINCDKKLLNSEAKYIALLNDTNDYESHNIFNFLLKKKFYNIDSRTLSELLRTQCEYNNYDSVEILLNYGANPNDLDDQNCSALYIACKFNYNSIVKLLFKKKTIKCETINTLSYCCQKTSLMHACIESNYEIAEILISYGAKVNEKTKQNLTALMLSCLVDDNEQIVNLLCDNGANINDQDMYGDTAIMIAKKSKRSKVADLLIKRGACNDILCIPVDVD